MVNRYWLLATQSNLTCVCAALRSFSLVLSLFRSHFVIVTCVSNRIYVYWTERNCPLLLVNSVLLSMGSFSLYLLSFVFFAHCTRQCSVFGCADISVFSFVGIAFRLCAAYVCEFDGILCVVWLLIATISWNNKLFSMCKRVRWKHFWKVVVWNVRVRMRETMAERTIAE